MRQQMNDYKRRRTSSTTTTATTTTATLFSAAIDSKKSVANNVGAVLGAGCHVPLNRLPDGMLRAAQQSLTFYPANAFADNNKTNRSSGGAPPAAAVVMPVQSYQVESDVLVVPRCYGARVFNADPSGLSEGDSSSTTSSMRFAGELRGRQVQAATASLASLRSYPHAAMLVLPCGFGKTVVGLSIAAELGRKTLVVVHKEFLLEQWRDRIKTFLPGVKVGVIQGPRCDVEDCDVVVGMVASLTSESRKYDEKIMRSFGTVILDEAHHMAARYFSNVFFRLPAKYVLGLTATPKRKDGCTALLHEHMGSFAFKEDPDPGTALVLRVSYASPWFRRRDDELAPGEVQRLKTKMAADENRNSLLVSWCLEAAAVGRRTLLLSDRVQHLHDLHAEYKRRLPSSVEENNNTPPPAPVGIDRSSSSGSGGDEKKTEVAVAALASAVYIGGLKRAERDSASEATTIFGTFSLAQEGLDIPALDTLILATPASDVTQAVGRILRAHEGKMRAVVIDIQDDTCKNFLRLNNIRASTYRQRTFEMIEVNADDHSALS